MVAFSICWSPGVITILDRRTPETSPPKTSPSHPRVVIRAAFPTTINNQNLSRICYYSGAWPDERNPPTHYHTSGK